MTPLGSTWKPSWRQRALQHDFGLVLERVRDDAGVGGRDDVALAVHLEPVVERVLPAQDRGRHDVAVQLQPLAVPRRRAAPSPLRRACSTRCRRAAWTRASPPKASTRTTVVSPIFRALLFMDLDSRISRAGAPPPPADRPPHYTTLPAARYTGTPTPEWRRRRPCRAAPPRRRSRQSPRAASARRSPRRRPRRRAPTPFLATATPVKTWWTRPLNAVSIAAASAASRGLPRMRPSTTTTVSAPRTVRPGCRSTPACALARASRRTCASGRLAGQRRLVDVHRIDGEGKPCRAQQFGPARRGRGEHDRHRAR